MEAILSVAAITISVLALVLTGLFDAIWDRKIKRARISLSVVNVRFIRPQTNPDSAIIEISDELQEYTRTARHFPTLDRQTKVKVVDFVLNRCEMLGKGLPRLRELQRRLQDETVTDEDAKRLWKEVPKETKAWLFSIESLRLQRDSIKDVDFGAIVPEILQNFPTPSAEPLRKHAMARALGTVLPKIMAFEEDTSKTELRALLDRHLVKIEEECAEADHVRRHLDRSKVVTDPPYLQLDLKLFNAGESIGTLYAIAALAIQRQAKGNLVVLLEPMDANVNALVVPPGQHIDLNLRTRATERQDLLDALSALFAAGDRDFRVILQDPLGSKLLSERRNFSTRAPVDLAKQLEGAAETCKIDA